MNPFDPLNFKPIDIPKVREDHQSYFDSVKSDRLQFKRDLDSYLSRFSEDLGRNQSIAAYNDSIRQANTAKSMENASIRQTNQTSPPESLRLLQTLDTLKYFVIPSPSADSAEVLRRVELLEGEALVRMQSVNGEYYPVVIFDTRAQDSLRSDFDELISGLRTFFFDAGSAGIQYQEKNDSIRLENAAWLEANADIRRYNDSIHFRLASAAGTLIDRPDSLVKAVERAGPGASLYLEAGKYQVRLNFTQSGTAENPILVHGHPDMTTVLAPAVPGGGILSLSRLFHIRFKNIVFRESGSSGVKLEDSSRGISFHNCRFEANAPYGVDAHDSHLELVNCEIVNNDSSGIRAGASSHSAGFIRLVNVLIARNGGSGLEMVTVSGTLSGVTIADNAQDGMFLASQGNDVPVLNSIIGFNKRFGIYRQPTTPNSAFVLIANSNLYGNVLSDFAGDTTAILSTGLLRTDPLFRDRASGDYGVDPGSEIARREADFGLVIGYRKP